MDVAVKLYPLVEKKRKVYKTSQIVRIYRYTLVLARISRGNFHIARVFGRDMKYRDFCF